MSHSNRNGFSDELAAVLAEARDVHARLGQLLAQAQPRGQRRSPQISPQAGQPYPFRTRPQKMAPPEFELGPLQLQAGLDEGLLAGQVRREWAKFKDHTFGVARQDWDATWRNWIRTGADRLPRLGTQKPAQPVQPRRQRVADEPPADPGDALVSVRGIIDKLTGRKMP